MATSPGPQEVVSETLAPIIYNDAHGDMNDKVKVVSPLVFNPSSFSGECKSAMSDDDLADFILVDRSKPKSTISPKTVQGKGTENRKGKGVSNLGKLSPLGKPVSVDVEEIDPPAAKVSTPVQSICYVLFFERYGSAPDAIVWDGRHNFFRVPSEEIGCNLKTYTPILCDSVFRQGKALQGNATKISSFLASFAGFPKKLT